MKIDAAKAYFVVNSRLSGFWSTPYYRHNFELFSLAHAELPESFEKLSGSDLTRIPHTIGMFMHYHKDSRLNKTSIKNNFWQPIEYDYFSCLRKKISDLGPNNLTKSWKGLSRLEIQITLGNKHAYEKPISCLLDQTQSMIKCYSSVNLSDTSEAFSGMRDSLLKMDISSELMPQLFAQTTEIMTQRDPDFTGEHFTNILKMCGDLFIMPPKSFVDAAIGWVKDNIHTLGISHVMVINNIITDLNLLGNSRLVELLPSLRHHMSGSIAKASPGDFKRHADQALRLLF